jgi:hypothetical protein
MAKAAQATTTASTKHPGGRPTKLTRELVDKARKYIDVETKYGGIYHGDLPTVAGLSLYLDVARVTIYDWCKQESPLAKEFSNTVEKLDATQEYMLVGKSLKGEYNSNIASILLSNHGHIKKTHSETDLRVKEMPKPILGGQSQESSDV